MIAKLSKYKDIPQASIFLSGSKSESNRLLILQALYPDIEIENIAFCDDTTVSVSYTHLTLPTTPYV